MLNGSIKSNFIGYKYSKYFLNHLKNLSTTTRLHGHVKIDNLNKIKDSTTLMKNSIEYENSIFKKWSKFLQISLKEWENEVYSRQQIGSFEEEDINEKIGDYIYFNRQSPSGFDLLMRRNILNNKTELAFDVSSVPFLNSNVIHKISIKKISISEDNEYLSFILDIENNEKTVGGILNIKSQTFLDKQFLNISNIEFTKNSQFFVILENDNFIRPSKLILYDLSNNIEKEILFESKNDKEYLELSKTKDDSYMILNSVTKTDSEVNILNLFSFKLELLLPRIPKVKYFVDHCNVRIF